MLTLDEVKKQISELKDVDTFGTKKEIKFLPEILKNNEKIFGLTSGLMNGNTWLITLTNHRIIFLDKGILWGLKQIEMPLDKVNSVECSTSIIFGKIAIWDGASKMEIDGILKKSIKPFVDAVNEQLRRHKERFHNNGLEIVNDLATQLKRLANLKDEGILTEEEFNQQKKKLLAS